MSLSFVKSAVLSSTDGVSHNEEVTVDSSEAEALRKRGETKSLFAQLQENKDAEMAEEEERRRAMREAMSLNEEDCAHLDSLEITKREKEMAKHKLEEEELAVFRAAKTYLEVSKESEPSSKIYEVGTEAEDFETNNNLTKKQTTATPLMPVILGKRKKKVLNKPEQSDEKNTNELNHKKPKKQIEKASSEEEDEGLGGLLGGYGSDSDSE